jgi:sugar phosphate isomerase/epimerase
VGHRPSISVQLYTVRDALAADPDSTIRTLAGLGYANVEPFQMMANADLLLPYLRTYHMRCPSAHEELAVDDLDEIFSAARRLGVGTVIDNSLAPGAWLEEIPEAWRSEDGISAIAAGLNEAARRAARYDLRVGYHNHHWETASRIDGRIALEVLADHLAPGVALEVDVYWAAAGGADVAAMLGRLGERVRFLHVKDGPVQPNFAGQVPLGRGRMPIEAILGAAPHLQAAVVEFDDFAGDIYAALRESLEYLTSFLGAVVGGDDDA